MSRPEPLAPAPLADGLLQAAQTFFPDLISADAIPGHPDIARVTTPSGRWRVRRWPPTAAEPEIAFSREVMAAARNAGLSLVPPLAVAPASAPHGVLRRDGRLYAAQAWLPGAPPARAEVDWPDAEDHIDLPVALSPAPFSAVIAAVAALHESTTALAPHPGAPAAPLAMLPHAVRQAHERHLSALRARARREPAIQRWLATGERLLAAAEPTIDEATHGQRLPVSVLHFGLWPSHVLLAEDSVTGLLGWERVTVGSPLLDLAQAMVHLQGWSDEAVELAVGVYSDVRPLSPAERRLLPAVAALEAVVATGRLLEQTYVTAETARPPTALRAGIDTMLRSLTALERSLNAQAKVGKSKRTPWRHAPRPAPARAGGRPRERRR